jgi:hypothetical protein
VGSRKPQERGALLPRRQEHKSSSMNSPARNPLDAAAFSAIVARQQQQRQHG